jgi:hypothetical protein
VFLPFEKNTKNMLSPLRSPLLSGGSKESRGRRQVARGIGKVCAMARDKLEEREGTWKTVEGGVGYAGYATIG